MEANVDGIIVLMGLTGSWDKSRQAIQNLCLKTNGERIKSREAKLLCVKISRGHPVMVVARFPSLLGPHFIMKPGRILYDLRKRSTNDEAL